MPRTQLIGREKRMRVQEKPHLHTWGHRRSSQDMMTAECAREAECAPEATLAHTGCSLTLKRQWPLQLLGGCVHPVGELWSLRPAPVAAVEHPRRCVCPVRGHGLLGIRGARSAAGRARVARGHARECGARVVGIGIAIGAVDGESVEGPAICAAEARERCCEAM